MPDIIYNNRKRHKCSRCRKMIQKGEGYKVYHYSDKDMYYHLKSCK